MFTHYDDMKDDKDAEIGVFWGLVVLKVIGNMTIQHRQT